MRPRTAMLMMGAGALACSSLVTPRPGVDLTADAPAGVPCVTFVVDEIRVFPEGEIGRRPSVLTARQIAAGRTRTAGTAGGEIEWAPTLTALAAAVDHQIAPVGRVCPVDALVRLKLLARQASSAPVGVRDVAEASLRLTAGWLDVPDIVFSATAEGRSRPAGARSAQDDVVLTAVKNLVRKLEIERAEWIALAARISGLVRAESATEALQRVAEIDRRLAASAARGEFETVAAWEERRRVAAHAAERERASFLPGIFRDSADVRLQLGPYDAEREVYTVRDERNTSYSWALPASDAPRFRAEFIPRDVSRWILIDAHGRARPVALRFVAGGYAYLARVNGERAAYLLNFENTR